MSSRYSQGVAGIFFSTGSRLLSSRFTGSRILLNGFKTIVQQTSQGVAGFAGFFSTGSRLMSSRYSQGVAGIFFSTGSRLLSSRFTGSRWVILLNGFQNIVQQIHIESWVILLNGFQTIVQQILRDSLGHSSQRVLDYCPVDSQGVAVSFFSTGSRLMSSRYSQGVAGIFFSTGSRLVVLQIHRESLGYSSQRVLDYCPLDSQGVAGLFFSTGPRLLSSRFPGSRWVILLNGFQTIVQYILRESLGYSSQRLPDYCQVDSQGVAGLFSSTGSRLMSSRYSQGVAGIFFSTGSKLLSSRFTGSRWVILLNGFQTIVQQILRDSLGHSSQRVLDYCQVDSQGVVGLFFSTGSRILSSRFTESRWVILLNGFQTIVQQILRDSLGHSSQRVLDYCPVDSQGVVGLFFSTGSRLLSSRFTGSRCVILLNGFQTNVQQIFTGSRWVILLNGFQTNVQQIHRESLGYSSQRVLDYCQVDSLGVAGLFFSTGSRLLSSRFTESRWVILLNGFQTIVQQILRDSLGHSSQRVLDYCPVDSQGVIGLFFSTGSRLLSSRFTGSRWVILLNGFQTNVQQIFKGSRWDFLLNGFQTIVLQIHRESLGYSSQRVPDYCPVGSQGVAGSFFSTGSRLLSSIFSGSRWVILLRETIVVDSGSRWVFSTGSRLLSSRYSQGVAGFSSQRVLNYCLNGFSTGSRLLSSRFTGSRWVILLNGFQTNVQQIFTGSRWDFLLNGFQTVVLQIHRESLGYSSQRVPDYCPVDSQGVAGSFFSTGSRLLSTRFTGILLNGSTSGSRWDFLLNGFQTIDYCWVLLNVDNVHRESLGFSSQRVLDCCPFSLCLNGFQTNVQQIFTGSRWDFLLNGFQTVVLQIHRESLGYSSQRVPDYCPVGSQGVAGSFFSTGSRLLSTRFTGSRWVILLNGFQTIVQYILRGSLGYSSQRVLDCCPVDSQGVAGLFFSTGPRLLSSRFTGSRWDILFHVFQTNVHQIFTGSRWDFLLNASQTVVLQIQRESLGYSSRRVLDYCPVVIHRGLLGYTSQRLPDYCQVDSQGVAGLFSSTGSRLMSTRYSLGVAGIFFSTGSRLLSCRFTGSRWVILLNGFQTIVQ